MHLCQPINNTGLEHRARKFCDRSAVQCWNRYLTTLGLISSVWNDNTVTKPSLHHTQFAYDKRYLYCFIGFEVWEEKRQRLWKNVDKHNLFFCSFQSTTIYFHKRPVYMKLSENIFSTSVYLLQVRWHSLWVLSAHLKWRKTFPCLQITAGCWIIYIVPHAGRHKIQHPETVPATHWVLRTYLCLQQVWEKRLLNSLRHSAFLETEFILSEGFGTDEAELIIMKPSNLCHYLGFHVSHCASFSPLSGGESSGWRSLARLEPFLAGWAFPS